MAELQRDAQAGLTRSLAKLESMVQQGDLYGAHQLYKTLFSRYKNKGDHDAACQLVFDGALRLFEKDQVNSAGDLALTLLSLYKEVPIALSDASLDRVIRLFQAFPSDSPLRRKFIKQAIQWSIAVGSCSKGDPRLHDIFGHRYWNDKLFGEAQQHFLLGTERAPLALCGMIMDWAQRSPPSEIDLYITRVVLQYLALENLRFANVFFEQITRQHPEIKNPPFAHPLVNFCKFLLSACERDASPLFLMLRDKYSTELARDPLFEQYLNEIGTVLFKLPSRQRQGGGGLSTMLNDMLRSFMGPDPSTSSVMTTPTANDHLD